MEFLKQVIGSELKQFEQKFTSNTLSNNLLLNKIMHFIINRKGKQMRPMFIFLSAKIAGTINESTYRAASLIELLHTATLTHDDVVDNSMIRRNFFSVNALWKNKVAVLAGDYLLSKGLLLALEFKDYEILEITSRAVKEMSEGELLQIEKARKLDIEEAVYFEIIRAKTASLLSASCAAGAYSSSKDPEITDYFRLLGEKIGIAFQIKDDLFDYGKDAVGKPLGIDIKEKKMTLPLIYALSKADTSDKRKIIYLIKNKNTDKKSVEQVIEFVVNSGGIAYASEKMNAYLNESIKMLDRFPESEAKTAMIQLINFAVNRTY
jgi:octaprenyl-diphosphate synthase